MQSGQDRPNYPTVDNPSTWSETESGEGTSTAVSALEPYVPPNVPHGLPHVVRFATLSSMDLHLEVRFLIIMLARFANVDGVASVAVSTLCEICRIGSKNTVERWIGLAIDVGILRKEPGRGGKDRKSNTYVFLGAEREWGPLPVGRPDTNPIVALAQARRRIEELETELALLRNGHSNAHPEVTNGEGEPPAAPPADSYETADSGESHETHGAIGHFRVTNGPTERPTEPAFHSYENPVSDGSQGNHEAIGHSRVTNGLDEGQEYLSRRARVEELVLEHRGYYDRSFTGGVLSAIHYFAESPEREMELLRQVDLRRRAQEPDNSGVGPPEGIEGRSPPTNPESGRREVEYCPDCGSPYTTFNGEERCPDCTGRRRRESEA